MSTESILRFVTVRPAKAGTSSAGLRVLTESSGLLQQLSTAVAEGADRERLREIARNYEPGDGQGSESGDPRQGDAEQSGTLDVAPLREWFRVNERGPVGAADLEGAVQRSYGMSVAELAGSAEFTSIRDALTDRLLTTVLLGDEPGDGEQDLLDAKLLGLVLLWADSSSSDGASVNGKAGGGLEWRRSLGEVVAGSPALLPGFFARVREEPQPVSPVVSAGAEREAEERAWLAQLDGTHRELMREVVDGRHLQYGDAPGSEGASRAEPSLSAEGVARLNDESRGALERLGMSGDRIVPAQAIQVVGAEMQHVAARISAMRPSGLLAFDGGEIDLAQFRRALSEPRTATDVPPAPQHSEAGVADLLVVRQKIKAYELGEFAHIENVMPGETRDRSTRRLSQIEEITERETETETEKEKDLQSTTRNELQNEAEKHVKSQLDIEAGLQVSGSYGPAVTFTASLKAGHSTVTEESQRKATSFSQEVTQRTVEKVREKVRTLARRRTLEEFEENNRHGFVNNSTSRHSRGIYRWLNKVYDAQVYNYGQRLMFDFVVPEPAAYYLYGLVENPPQDSELVKPAAPTFEGQPLRPENLGPDTYGDLIARYRVANAPTPPPKKRVVAFFSNQDSGGPASSGRAGKIDIPDGYVANEAIIQLTMGPGTGSAVVAVDQELHAFTVSGTEKATLGENREREISVALSAKSESWALAIDVHCDRTTDAYARWQQTAYDAIIAAYQQQLAEYNERKAQRELQRSSQHFGRNPLINRRVERDELKKWVIMMMAKNPDINLDSFRPPETPGTVTEPVLDLDKANANGKFIKFLENAFEWQNMLYVFYPHMWGRRARWISALNITDSDPDFAAFLRAGAARVQVPVRPGFESAVAYFIYFGTIWSGNDVPRVEDQLYVPIIDEITSNLGKLDGGVPYPANSRPWEVLVPTDLVLVQDVSEVPPLRDALKPGTVTLHSEITGDGGPWRRETGEPAAAPGVPSRGKAPASGAGKAPASASAGAFVPSGQQAGTADDG